MHLYFLWYRIWFYRKWFYLIHTKKITHSQFVLYKLFLLKPISYNLFSKLLWTCSFICGCFTKSLFNICCPTCLTNSSLTSQLIYGHFVIMCLFIL